MNDFTYSYPMKVYFGKNAAQKAFIAELGRFGKTVMLAYGGGSIKKAGVYEEMKTMLQEAGKEIVEFSGIMPNPTYAKVQEGAALTREHGVDFILAVGGGSVIDCCKVISAQAMLVCLFGCDLFWLKALISVPSDISAIFAVLFFREYHLL